ncbi:MAG TPA: di-heme oxidoredictase family protein [Myxococcota bacterium]|nr:di-heme oxidoredictase family protein [Myxococcota bacterium]
MTPVVERVGLGIFLAALAVFTRVPAAAVVADDAELSIVDLLHDPVAEHCDQQELNAIGDAALRFEVAFGCGDELFEVRFNALDGVGMNVGDEQRFTRVPRADLDAANEWARTIPARTTGPNGSACVSCHNEPFDDGAGLVNQNVIRDPLHTADPGRMIQRNTPQVFALGALQRLAEEMTTGLQAVRRDVVARACAASVGSRVRRDLAAKGVSFGAIAATRVSSGGESCPVPSRNRVRVDGSAVAGVGADLVVRPLQWKGANTSLRDFNRGAAHNELGMQPVELTGDGVDGDFDGVVDEMTVGDMTALAVYLAAQPRPVTKLELNALGLLDPPLTALQVADIRAGEALFARVRCTDCHRASLRVDDPVFREPSRNASYRDATFPAGQSALAEGVDPANPVAFDLTRDQPDNRLVVNGREVRLGAFERDGGGGAVGRLYGDLKRHEMGARLAERIDETGSGASSWLTAELWGVGSTAPYLHDGRATTLTEAVIEHGGEAAASRNAARALRPAEQAQLLAFLENLVLFKIPEE